jgi:CRP/FNR family cyclic AMP-dependent transcriptional regulator
MNVSFRASLGEARDYRVEVLPPGAIVYRPGDAGDRVFVLKGGQVRLFFVGRSGSPSVTAILKAGDVFGADPFRGEAEVMDELAVAGDTSEVWSIDARRFRAQVDARPGMALELLRAYAERVRALQQRALALTVKDVPARLAETVLVLADALGVNCPHGGETDLKHVTQQDLADLVGASRSFVSTLLNELKREGVLGNVGRTLCLRDRRALAKLAALEK